MLKEFFGNVLHCDVRGKKGFRSNTLLANVDATQFAIPLFKKQNLQVASLGRFMLKSHSRSLSLAHEKSVVHLAQTFSEL